ncbi:MAG TPA: restriction endonuclease subunit S [Pyrinomonadaceae bacterium]
MQTTELGKACEINPRIDKDISLKEDCSFVPMEFVNDEFGIITKQEIRRISDVIKGYTFFKDEDVLFAKITPCMENGKAAIAKRLKNGIGFGSTEFHVLRAKKEITIPQWIYYYIRQKNVRDLAERRMTGSAGQQRVPSSFLQEELLIPLPKPDEQKRIAEILDKADRLRRQRRFAQTLSDSFLQSVFIKMFGDPRRNPNGYDIFELEDFVHSFQGGVNFNSVSESESDGWKVLKISAVTWGEFNPKESKSISRDESFSDTFIVKKGDLLISRANTTELVGAVCMVREKPPKVLLPDKLWRIKFINNSPLLPDYTLHLLRQKHLRKIIGDLATGSSGSMKNISKEKAATLPIMLPPLPLQEKFAEIVQKFERVRRQQREATRQAEHLFQTLLHRAFRGEL